MTDSLQDNSQDTSMADDTLQSQGISPGDVSAEDKDELEQDISS